MKLFNLLFFALFTLSLSAQTLDEELGFIYVKADYLMETGRYDEAVREFTKIIAKDPNYRDALYKRAEAKYNVGAYQGTYNDVLQIFENKGVTPDALELFGKAQKSIGKADASETTLETYAMLSSSGNTAREKTTRQNDDASTSSEDDGSGKSIKDQISDILSDILPKSTPQEEPTNNDTGTTGQTDTSTGTTNDRQTKGGRQTGDDDSGSGGSGPILDTSRSNPAPLEPAVDDSVREVYIDEDVTLELKNGIGARKILQQPSILILSESSGNVVIDICINANGKVTQAEYNAGESSLSTQSIISHAERKSKEFWFKSSTQDEMCGTIVFKITGS